MFALFNNVQIMFALFNKDLPPGLRGLPMMAANRMQAGWCGLIIRSSLSRYPSVNRRRILPPGLRPKLIS